MADTGVVDTLDDPLSTPRGSQVAANAAGDDLGGQARFTRRAASRDREVTKWAVMDSNHRPAA